MKDLPRRIDEIAEKFGDCDFVICVDGSMYPLSNIQIATFCDKKKTRSTFTEYELQKISKIDPGIRSSVKKRQRPQVRLVARFCEKKEV